MTDSTQFTIQLDTQDIVYLGAIKGEYESPEHALERGWGAETLAEINHSCGYE